MKKLLFFFFLCFFFQSALAQNISLENLLFNLPDISFKKIESTNDQPLVYELRVKQAIDHQNSAKGFFYQKVFLTHQGFDRPTVIVTEGYNRDKNYIYELSDLLNANQIAVEHRFFGESLPDSLDYNYLNLQQATADLHHINTLFKQIYTGKWLSTGISKGGATTIFYRYFFPDDVDVSVPYVAPINREFEDKRIYTFLDTVGSDVCRKEIQLFQRRLLEKRKQLLPLLKWYYKGARSTFTYLTFEQAFEYAVLEYSFSFWQYGHDCKTIPSKKASIDEMLEHFISISGLSFFSDKPIDTYGPHYYQSAAEMGYYGYETAAFKDLLQALPTTSNPHATFAPNKIPVRYDGQLLEKVNAWLPLKANRFIYINGDIDTWSATAVRPSKNVDALWFFMAGKHHANARIKNMSDQERAKLISKLEQWLSIEID